MAMRDEADTVPAAFEAAGAKADVLDVTVALPPDPHSFDGVVIGGSRGSVHDPQPWRRRLREWVQAHGDVPMLGICGGHQLVAHVNGARVERLALPQFGVYPLDLPDVQGFHGRVVQVHEEHVVDVPPGAELWARDETCLQALRYPGHRWGVQFHPEFSEDVAHAIGATFGPSPLWSDEAIAAGVASGRALLARWLEGL